MKKNIMFIVPSLTGGGAEKTVANLSKYLSNKFNVYIVALKETSNKYDYSGNYICLSNNKKKSFIGKICFTISCIHKVKKIKKRYNISYSISFLATADIINVLSKNKGTKNYISIRNTDSLYTMNTIYKRFTKISCKLSDHIISISKQVKMDLINNFKVKEEKISVIYNPAIISNNNKSSDKPIINDNFIINIGRMTNQKGQWHLIRAFNEVLKKYPDKKLVILGDGELRNYLESLIKDYKIENNVLLPGFVDNPYQYLINADAFVFSSCYEGLGNSILEALSCQIPVISTDCISGPREILNPNSNFLNKVTNKIDYAEYGILTPVCNGVMYKKDDDLSQEEILLYKAIIDIISNKKMNQHYRKMSKIRSVDFEINKIIKQWEKLLK